MPRSTKRSCSINEVPVLLRIAHGHLDPAYRLETSTESREKITFDIRVEWEEAQVDSFEKLFNYASLYRILQDMQDRVVTGPLEGVLDEVDKTVRTEAAKQGITLTTLHVGLQRPDLLHGYVVLTKES